MPRKTATRIHIFGRVFRTLLAVPPGLGAGVGQAQPTSEGNHRLAVGGQLFSDRGPPGCRHDRLPLAMAQHILGM